MSYINNGLRGEGGTEHAGHGGYLKTFKPSAIGQLFDKGPLPPPPVSIPLPGNPNAVTKRKVRNRKVLRKIPTEDLEKFLAEIARLKQPRTYSDTTMGTAPASSLDHIRPRLSDLSFGSHMDLDTPVTDTTGGLRPIDSASNAGGFNAGPPRPYNTDLGAALVNSSSTSSSSGRFVHPPDAATPTGPLDINPNPIGPMDPAYVGALLNEPNPPRPPGRRDSGHSSEYGDPPDDAYEYVTLFRNRDASTTEIANTVGHDAAIDQPTQRNLVAGTPISSVLDEGLIITDGAMDTETLVAMPAPSTEPTGPGQTLASVISEDTEERDRRDRRALMLQAATGRARHGFNYNNNSLTRQANVERIRDAADTARSNETSSLAHTSLMRQATVARIRAADEQEALSLTAPRRSGRYGLSAGSDTSMGSSGPGIVPVSGGSSGSATTLSPPGPSAPEPSRSTGRFDRHRTHRPRSASRSRGEAERREERERLRNLQSSSRKTRR